MRGTLQVDNVIKKFKSLNKSVQMLFLILMTVRPSGEVNLGKKSFAKHLKITEQTAGNHIKSFVESGLIKYKYSGTMRVNPNFYYTGKPEDFAQVLNEYESFKSDM